uniref:PBPb domain-containing protein n=1 Tax=Caenorhabditis tropicalis TaxID=1561998 RepID=A0A1I7TSN1_9PELO
MKSGFKNLRAVGYQTDVPYVALSDYCWSFSCPKPGAEVEFLDLTFQVMNSTGTIIQIDADIEQSIDMVANGTADITLVTARQTLDRMKKVDFTTPIGFVYYGYLVREIPEIAVADYIMGLFDYDTLAILISFGIIIGALVYLYTWIFDQRIRTIWDWMIISCSGIIRQFMFKISSPICALVIIGFWLWCCQVIITYYEAKLKSFLLLSHHRGTIFNTLDGVLEAAEHKGWTLVVQERGYTPYLWCNPEQCKRLDRLKSKTMIIGADDDMNLVISQDKHVGFSAVASDLAQSDITYFDFHSKIIFVRDKIMAPEYLAYAVNK